MKMTVIPIVGGALGNVLKGLEKTEGNGDQKFLDDADHIIMEIS